MPDGLSGPNAPRFWQKNTPSYYPRWIPRIEIPTGAGKPVLYALVNDLQSLLYFVNQGTITFHTYFSRVDDLEHPDFVLFDLDPHQARFSDAVAIAKALHDALAGEGVESFVKTTGKSGLHVLVDWNRRGDYDEARSWALAIAQARLCTAAEDRDNRTTDQEAARAGLPRRDAERPGAPCGAALCASCHASSDGVDAAALE